ncbi:MAG: sensor histidine kinase, partial [Desulfomonilaceae bacterium]|nr:sensor histidine kinase [Desulfomonilaceae bacterium]
MDPFMKSLCKDEKLRVMAIIPIIHEEKLQGSFNIGSRSSREIPALTRGALEAIAAMVGGIIARIKTQTLLQASLLEKEVLFKEIHHRVKNNLQLISSLLNIQALHVDDPQLRQAFNESRHRVRSMALVHERLYQSGNLSHIDFGEYLKKLVANLSRAYEKANVICSVDAEAVELGIDTAIPCGLIVSELMTNALKYAFPGDSGGAVTVSLKRGQGESLKLAVKDDGVGFSGEKDFSRI